MISSIGDHRQFSVNWVVDWQSSKYPWLFGGFYISVGGSALGDLDDLATLNATLALAESWRDLSRNDSLEALFSASTLETFLSIENSSYGLDHLVSIVPRGFVPYPVVAQQSYQFDAGESSDGYRLYVLSRKNLTRMLFRTTDLPQECVVSTEYYDFVTESAACGINRDFATLRQEQE